MAEYARDKERERAMIARMGPGVVGVDCTPEEMELLDKMLGGTLEAISRLVNEHLSDGEFIRVDFGFLALWLGNVVGVVADRFLSSAEADQAAGAYRLIELNIVASLRQRAASRVAEGGGS